MNFDLDGKIAVITGGGGAICGEIARAYAREGMRIAVWDISLDNAAKVCNAILSDDGNAVAVRCDATDRRDVAQALEETLRNYGTVDVLVNGAGGSARDTTTSDELNFFDIDSKSMEKVLSLNYLSSVIPSQAVGRIFADRKCGVIINITSIAGILPLTRAITYSNGKAAANSFTRWLAVHMAEEYSPAIRVNAIAPGFMLTEQNRFLLLDEKSGKMTARGKQILENVPAGRYGEPREITGAALWLASGLASFVTGAVIPVDGGFTAFCGV